MHVHRDAARRRRDVPRRDRPGGLAGVRRADQFRAHLRRRRRAGAGRVRRGRGAGRCALRLLPGGPAIGHRVRRSDARHVRPERAGHGRAGEAVRHRPGVGRAAQRGAAQGLRRRSDLPDRPLPGQGGRAEHPGVALRQRPVRTGVEPPARVLRPDRRPGRDRHSGPGRLHGVHRDAPGHDLDAPVPAARLRGPRPAFAVRRRVAASRDHEGVPRDPRRRTRTGSCSASTTATGTRPG